MENNCHSVDLLQIIELWFQSKLKNEYCIWSTSITILWLERSGVILVFLAGLSIVIDIVGEAGLRKFGRYLERVFLPNVIIKLLSIGFILLAGIFLFKISFIPVKDNSNNFLIIIIFMLFGIMPAWIATIGKLLSRWLQQIATWFEKNPNNSQTIRLISFILFAVGSTLVLLGTN